MPRGSSQSTQAARGLIFSRKILKTPRNGFPDRPLKRLNYKYYTVDGVEGSLVHSTNKAAFTTKEPIALELNKPIRGEELDQFYKQEEQKKWAFEDTCGTLDQALEGSSITIREGQAYFKEGLLHGKGDNPAIIGKPYDITFASSGAAGRILLDSQQRVWAKEGQLHRDKGPAIVIGNWAERHFKSGRLHREDGPASTHIFYDSDWECLVLERAYYKDNEIASNTKMGVKTIEVRSNSTFQVRLNEPNSVGPHPIYVTDCGVEYWRVDGKMLTQGEVDKLQEKVNEEIIPEKMRNFDWAREFEPIGLDHAALLLAYPEQIKEAISLDGEVGLRSEFRAVECRPFTDIGELEAVYNL